MNNKTKVLFQNLLFLKKTLCSSNNNFVANAVFGVRNSGVLLETRLREFNRIAVDVGGGGDVFFRAVSHQLYRNPNKQLGDVVALARSQTIGSISFKRKIQQKQ